MLYEILSFLLDVAAGVLGGACLLRMYMQHQKIGFGNPVGRFVFALTDWLVLPLRRVLPAVGRLDTSSMVGAWLLQLARYGLLYLLAGRGAGAGLLPVLALFGLLRLAISSVMVLMVVYAIMSWTRTDSPISDVVDRLCAPMLRPLRKLIPLVGGIDLSPMALLVGLQVLLIVLASAQSAVFR